MGNYMKLNPNILYVPGNYSFFEEDNDIKDDRGMNIRGTIPKLYPSSYIRIKFVEGYIGTSLTKTVGWSNLSVYSSTKGFERSIEKLKFRGKMIKLKKPLQLSVDYKDNICEVSNEETGLFAISDSFDKAIDIISEKFETLYGIYVEDNSMELTKDALKLRKKLIDYI